MEDIPIARVVSFLFIYFCGVRRGREGGHVHRSDCIVRREKERETVGVENSFTKVFLGQGNFGFEKVPARERTEHGEKEWQGADNI